MIVFVVLMLPVIIITRMLWLAELRREAHAEAMFRVTIKALEEKAKREGTFHVSYFKDKDTKDN